VITDNTTYLGLLDDILDHPEDDTPRLVMADWLEDNDQPERAEFIRVQIELDHLRQRGPCDECLRDVKAQSLRLRERELLEEHAHTWLSGIPGLKAFALNAQTLGWEATVQSEISEMYEIRPIYPTWRRGFVANIRLSHDSYVAHAPHIFSWHPVEKVTLSDREPYGPVFTTRYMWRLDGIGVIKNALHQSLYRRLPGYTDGRVLMHYASLDKALDAQNQACLAYGRAYRRKRRTE
jgi:uncharacterized protein (TIGR02996 family)